MESPLPSRSKLGCDLIHVQGWAKKEHAIIPCRPVIPGVQGQINTRWCTNNYTVHKTKQVRSLADSMVAESMGSGGGQTRVQVLSYVPFDTSPHLLAASVS